MAKKPGSVAGRSRYQRRQGLGRRSGLIVAVNGVRGGQVRLRVQHVFTSGRIKTVNRQDRSKLDVCAPGRELVFAYLTGKITAK